jgi:general transcription factor IIIA
MDCNGKTFSTQKGLRAHQKLHEQRELDIQLQSEDEEGPPRKRRRGGEFGRDWGCEVIECGKKFKSV